MGEGIGSKKICPMIPVDMDFQHCLDDCEWNDGEGCAIWRIVKALERLAIALNPMVLRALLDGKGR